MYPSSMAQPPSPSESPTPLVKGKRKTPADVFDQTLIPGLPPAPVTRIIINETEVTERKFQAFSRNSEPIGLSVGYTSKGELEAMAVTNGKICAVIKSELKKEPEGRAARNAILEKHVLCRDVGEVYAFDMDAVAMAALQYRGLRISHAVDIQSAFDFPKRRPVDCIKACIGEDGPAVSTKNIQTAFTNEQREANVPFENSISALCLRAWTAQFLASYENGISTFASVKRIDTRAFTPELLKIIVNMVETTRRVNDITPKTGQHQFLGQRAAEDASISIDMKTFSNRLRSGQSVVVEQLTAQGERITRYGTVDGVNGRRATFNFEGGKRITIENGDKTLLSITSLTRASQTNTDMQTHSRLRRVLQGDFKLFEDNVWVQNVLMAQTASDMVPWPDSRVPPLDPQQVEEQPSRQRLNTSQQIALDDMLATRNPVTLIQGPPGTGKTSVIAAFIETATSVGYSGIWLIAQSNVAAKNIAEKLMKVNFNAWRLLVSQDFIHEWHDHLYDEIKQNIIISNEFRTISNHRIDGVKVFVCTLSMLSNQWLSRFTHRVPMRILVVDEASQIRTAEYINIFTTFHTTLQKMCFIGDPKQLPPHGADDIEQIQSIFEVEHLQANCLLLNTQYRMPTQLGNFISNHVYDDKLLSWNKHPVPADIPCIFFVDVSTGREGMTKASSFEGGPRNIAEANAAIAMAIGLESKHFNYRIITPYDGQRNLIENKMKEGGLNWADKCFNVDSFQGNEDDVIIISLVRSRSIGFLKSLRRTNVMLTRCKKAMYILSSKSFLGGVGSDSLVGDLAEVVGGAGWLTVEEAEKINS